MGVSSQLDVSDPRFSRVLHSHDFALDPTNPAFKVGYRRVAFTWVLCFYTMAVEVASPP